MVLARPSWGAAEGRGADGTRPSASSPPRPERPAPVGYAQISGERSTAARTPSSCWSIPAVAPAGPGRRRPARSDRRPGGRDSAAARVRLWVPRATAVRRRAGPEPRVHARAGPRPDALPAPTPGRPGGGRRAAGGDGRHPALPARCRRGGVAGHQQPGLRLPSRTGPLGSRHPRGAGGGGVVRPGGIPGAGGRGTDGRVLLDQGPCGHHSPDGRDLRDRRGPRLPRTGLGTGPDPCRAGPGWPAGACRWGCSTSTPTTAPRCTCTGRWASPSTTWTVPTSRDGGPPPDRSSRPGLASAGADEVPHRVGHAGGDAGDQQLPRRRPQPRPSR